MSLSSGLKAYWQGNVSKLPETNKEYVSHMRKNTPDHLLFGAAVATLFVHLGIRFQGNCFPHGNTDPGYLTCNRCYLFFSECGCDCIRILVLSKTFRPF